MKIHKHYIEADEGKILNCIWDSLCYGKIAYLGKVFYKNGNKLDIPYILKVEDFEELDEDGLEIIDNKIFDFRGHSYADIKTSIIKLHYSNDDQIALMLNYQSDIEKYAQAYQTMQEWRDYAGDVAKKYTTK